MTEIHHWQCLACNYSCNRKSRIEMHEKTQKHQNNVKTQLYSIQPCHILVEGSKKTNLPLEKVSKQSIYKYSYVLSLDRKLIISLIHHYLIFLKHEDSKLFIKHYKRLVEVFGKRSKRLTNKKLDDIYRSLVNDILEKLF